MDSSSKSIKKEKERVHINDEIEKITLHRFRPFLLHLNIAPFFLSYLIWFYTWIQHFGLEEYPELGMIITAVIAILQVLTCLFCYWFVEVRVFMQCSREMDPLKAEVAKIKPTANNGYTVLVPINYKYLLQESSGKSEKKIWFYFQKTKYIFDQDEKKEFKAVEFPVNETLQTYLDSKGFQTDQQLLDSTSYFGINQMIMDIPKFIELFIERATAPFFVFQVFCVLLWCLDEYWYYSVFTLFMLITFECTLVQQQLKNMQLIRQMGNKPFKIMVYRNRKWTRIESDQLIPGDICSVGRIANSDTTLPCDLLLLRGQCIINESMLTGESVPVMKESIETRVNLNENFDSQTDGKLHVLFGGTTIVQHSPPNKQDSGLKAQDNGCIAYVLRTGFNTSQGKLLRTIMYSVKRVTANNLETFLFILFLLIFAIAASAYVWVEGCKNPNRSRYKLLLECTLILTSVIPPELPIELALAVNTSLVSLAKLGIFCTEPFRIPFAGKIDIACFDKTGTLTSDDLVVEGVTGIDGSLDVKQISELPNETISVLATCHTLINLDDEIIGDPLEKVTLQTIDWTVTKNDSVVPKKANKNGWKIHQRFHFSSSLKRMSVIAGHTKAAGDTQYIASCKGAPEILKPMLKKLPDNYDEIYLHYAREGARVLSLGYKELGNLSPQQLRDLNRNDVESELDFYGFLIISCPLKPDTLANVREISNSSHHVTMITGDNILTACHVASELKFIRKDSALLLTKEDSNWFLRTIDDKVSYRLEEFDFFKKNKKDNLCLTGEGFEYLYRNDLKLLKQIVSRIKVFARVSPKQKEQVITLLKSLGYVTLMCGDGTNDVGALKHSDVGVALLSNSDFEKKRLVKQKELIEAENTIRNNDPGQLQTIQQQRVNRVNLPLTPQQQAVQNAQKRIQTVMKELEEAEQSHIVKLGDASIASPFTYKQSSIQCVCHIIKQGRCTLVTTLQMFKILALNALILAYSQSVLYLDGIKLSDGQATMQGLLLAGCFLFISRSQPLKVLSKTRPLPNIFNIYTILTVLIQFAVHLCSLIYLTNEAHARSPPREEEFPNLETEFKPSLLNTTVYIISLTLQVATFAVNYKGHPFMESLRENKPLLGSILFSSASIFVLLNRLSPETCDQFQVVELPDDFRQMIMMVVVLDVALCFVFDRVLEFLFGKARVKAV